MADTLNGCEVTIKLKFGCGEEELAVELSRESAEALRAKLDEMLGKKQQFINVPQPYPVQVPWPPPPTIYPRPWWGPTPYIACQSMTTNKTLPGK